MRLLRIGLTLGLIGLFAVPAQAERTYTCFGQVATHVGTPGEDNISPGVPGAVIVGLDGPDHLVGDYVCGGKGFDEELKACIAASGGPDGDVILGSSCGGPPGLYLGGGGNDHFWDNLGCCQADQVWRGNGGNDTYTQGYGNDDFYGGAGNDQTDGSEGVYGVGVDRLYGGDGDDSLNVSDDDTDPPDLVNGGAGNDVCWVDPDDTVINCELVGVSS